ncbi:23S rRNA (guanine(745)-N(1))-methyltransferase [Dickeya fangzhongdai]|uniref:23S rRNA (guanine(745)-N(1))-methyltransferase n=1 Tax=Dickeya fangzhongdai TaxID=1778540 RepID=UPI001CE3908E|nr:23S rRNA (guanine(745)-N(1))-methyltransferase [Dickeya fangzhongdai]WOY00442.1 23S rRNA (guanine(745)-N(1))-methyltransferase [Dickeya fangzhongdai]WOY04407.1 23S rRNA (guanine(745)-N(1))-methyltransferase [Dickeya fangzhongdai]
MQKSSVPYQCPLCHQPLNVEAGRWSCGRHHFDRAREGYVNLLPVQFKRSRQPGDSAEMMQARRAFLDNGHYQPLRDRVSEQLAARLQMQPGALLDIGCGEGYYTAVLADKLTPQGMAVYGLDVSKAAIQRAAKRYAQVMFCVASSQRLPFQDHSLAAVLKIYAPCNGDELARVIRPGGGLMTVSPGPNHLLSLKARVYQEVRPHPDVEEVFPGFVLETVERLQYRMTMTGADAASLLQMTPFAWRATPDVSEGLKAEAQFECETDFLIRFHRREG